MKNETEGTMTLVILVIIACIVIYYICAFALYIPSLDMRIKEEECAYKTVTSIENFPMSNFWENKIVSLVHYDDGSSHQTDYGHLYKIGKKSCK